MVRQRIRNIGVPESAVVAHPVQRPDVLGRHGHAAIV
jgi:hypothetical protein